MKISIIFLIALLAIISIQSVSSLPHHTNRVVTGSACCRSSSGISKKHKLLGAALLAKILLKPKIIAGAIIGGLIVKKIIKKKLIKDALIGGAAILIGKKLLRNRKRCKTNTVRHVTRERVHEHDEHHEHHTATVGNTLNVVKPVENTATEVAKEPEPEPDHKLVKRSISDMIKRDFELLSNFTHSVGTRLRSVGDFMHKQSDRLREASLTTKIAGVLASERVRSMGFLGRLA